VSQDIEKKLHKRTFPFASIGTLSFGGLGEEKK
jgi:hypothetical protein